MGEFPVAGPYVARPPLWPEVRALLLAAMAIFLYTIAIGILNGTDLMDFDRRRVLGHVHGGTLGWLTLGVFAASLWLFAQDAPVSAKERRSVQVMVAAAIVAFPAYVAAFSLTYGNWRPIMGTASILVIAGFTGWVLYRSRGMTLTVPHLGFLAALGTSVVGGVLGVLLGLEIATGDDYLPSGGNDAHPAVMVLGFLVPVGLALGEWSFVFPRPEKATRAGMLQMLLPFLGGLVLMTSLLWDITPLAPVAIALQIIGIVIFVRRMWPHFRAVDFRSPEAGRYVVMSTVGVIAALGIAQYFVIRYEGDINLAPANELLALDHSQFIGMMTNALFAMLMVATIGRRGSRVDDVVFVMVNVGIIGFVVGLLGDTTILKRVFTPIMGTGLIIGLAMASVRLLAAGDAAEDSQAPASPPRSVPLRRNA